METEVQRLRLLGLVGVLAAATMFLSDCIIMDSSASGAEFGRVALSRLAEAPNWRLMFGGIGGPIGACLFVVGFGHVYLSLAPGGRKSALLCSAGFAAGYIILGAWHAAGPMVAFVMRMDPGLEIMDHESWAYMSVLGMLGFVPAACSLLLLPLLILFRSTRYPKWFALFNPGLINLIGTVAFQFAPAPIGGYLVIGCGSLSFLLFFIISTVVLWHGGKPPMRINAAR